MDFFTNVVRLVLGPGAARVERRADNVNNNGGRAGATEIAPVGPLGVNSHCLQTYAMIPGGNQLGPSSIWYDPDLLSVRLEYAYVKRMIKVDTIGIIEVWKGRHEGEDVTIRWLADGHKSMENAVALAMEVKTMKRLEHPKITQFVGVAWSSAMRVQAVSEFMDSGNLGTLLSGLDATQLTWAERKCQVALDVTEALVYLHSLTEPLLAHRDINSSSILVDSVKGVKLSGFSSSRSIIYGVKLSSFISSLPIIYDENESRSLKDKLWLAPEVIMGERYTDRSDVYALGVLLAYLDTHKLPFEDTGRGHVGTITLIATGKATPTLSKTCPRSIRELVRCCLAFDSLSRPRAVEVWHRLNKIQKELR